MKRLFLIGFLALAGMPQTQTFAQGLIFPGAGPVSRSFGGATTAIPLDAAGAVYWNPATMNELPNSKIMFGSEFIYGDTHLGGTVPAGSVLGLFPQTTRTGLTRSDSGLSALPTIAVVLRQPESRWTMGLGIMAAAGGGVNYPGSPTNPLLTPRNPPPGPPPNTLGFGPNAATASFLVTSANLGYELSEQLTIGVGANVGTTLMSLDPAFFATPNDANGDGVFNFPSATHSRPFWGGGFQVGVLYKPTEVINVGLSYKSPMWYETFEFNASDEIGRAQTITMPFTLPQIISLGTAYKGIDRVVLAVDVRYLDYKTTKTLGQPISEGGVDWDSIWSVALGAQYEVNCYTTVRLGYVWNQNPIDATKTLFNAQLPGIIQHVLSAGATMQLTPALSTSIAYVHGFKNEIEGPIGQIPGANVTLDTEYDSVVFGLNVDF